MERITFDNNTKGNVKAIVREGRKYRKHPVRAWFGYQVVFPIVTVGVPFYFHYWKTALAFIALTVFDWCLMALRWIARAIRRMRATPEQLRTPEQNDCARLSAMREVHRLLEGPVISPKLVREEMAKTTDSGAVWDSAAWAIVDRVMSIDPNVWVNSFPSTG